MTLRVAAGFDPSLFFDDPVEVWAPSTLEGALVALDSAERALEDGYWIAGALSYEFGTMLAGLRTFESSLPLLILGAFREPQERTLSTHDAVRMSAPLPRVSRASYEGRIARILQAITDGEVYQVNYTVPFDMGYANDPFEIFAFLTRRAHAPYSAFVEHETVSIASVSPELFLRFDGSRLTTKPMKGTAPLDAVDELHDEKNRAEHLMIVDLLRNDLHRICDGVSVPRLFEIERYPTFATMTSTIGGELRPNTTLTQIFRATFPCGSVTGAPKRAAMQHIAALEREARGFYTGAIGFLSPQRRGWWNVPIRTLQFIKNAPSARVDAGGGIVSDSRAASEWNEVLLKLRFLEPAFERFEILETLRGGPNPGDIAAHVDRLTRSAAAFGMHLDAKDALAQIRRAADTRDPELIRVRAGHDVLRIATEPLHPTPEPVALMVSSQRVRSDDPLLHHKTAWRPAHNAAAAEARERGCFDAILLNERGEIAEGSRTNIFARFGNTLYTPPLQSGVLPGILRSRLVSDGQAVERVLFERDLRAADAVYAGNSARGLLQARLQMNDADLYPYVLRPKMAPAIWGGDALVERFGKPGTPNEKIGESWECWDENSVLNGSCGGRSVADLRRELGAQLLGDLDPNQIFPILTKIIDARDSLSVQVHPDDAYAQRVEHQQNGKTECWYVLDAQPGAELVMGWTRNTSREEYERRVADGSLGDILHRVPVKAGDAFYIRAGTLHAIGAGIIIFETQQASDLTYRIFDWNRVGADGKPRELHVQKAADVLDYQQSTVNASLEELTYAYEGFQRTALIADSHFIVERVQATETAATMGTHSRPLIIMALDGGLSLSCPGGDAQLAPYQTALVPAGAQHVSICSTGRVTPFLCVTPPASAELMQKRLHDAGVAQPIIERFLAQFRGLTPAA